MITIYLADDEMWIMIGLKKLIEKSGLPFTIIGEADNGVLAFEDIKKQNPDLLITDIRMPGLSGLELVEKLAQEQLTTKVIFISGYAEFEYAQAAVRLGAYDYLLKPVELEQLQQVLERFQSEFSNDCVSGERAAEPVVQINQSTISQIISELQEHYTDNITLSSFSEDYGISVSHLSKLLKEEMGISFSEYITSRRIQKAKELLKDETLSIDAIAEMVGYNDYFYFIKVFKKHTGISPSKYRKNL